MARLPLFPLNTVLFPGGQLPLRIFEPRYKQMLRACMDGDRRLGIVLIKSGKEVGGRADPYSVGTVARIGEIGEPSSGAIPLTVTGERRFRIVSLDQSLPYLVGDVELLGNAPDPDSATAAAEFRALADRYLRLLFASHGEYRGAVQLSDDPAALEEVAGTLLFDHPVEVRQEVLEADPVSNRLRLAAGAILRSLKTAEAGLMRGGPGRDRTVFGIN